MDENDTIIIVQGQQELTQCQLQYLLEGRYFGERVCSQWTPSTIRRKIVHKDREITSLVREKIQREKELRLEKVRLYSVTEKNKVRERRTNEYVRQLENIILDHKQENYRLCCEHLLNETQKQIELFIEKETMFNNFRHVQVAFDELQRQYMTFVNSLLSENNNLRADIDRIDVNYRRQLGNLRSVGNEVNGFCATNDDRSRLSRSRSREVRTFDVAERNLNVKLNGEILRLQDVVREKDERALEEVRSRAVRNERLGVKLNGTRFQLENVLVSVQKTNVRLRGVTTRLKNDKHHVTGVLGKLRSYVRTTAEAFQSLKSRDNQLTAWYANRCVRLEDALETERITTVKLRDEITRLKDETRHVGDALKRLEDYLPTIANVLVESKLTNEELTAANTANANQMIRLENVLATERRTNVRLRDEVTHLKNEKNRMDGRRRSEVRKRIAGTQGGMTRVGNDESNRLTETVEISAKREQRLVGTLEERTRSSDGHARSPEPNGRSRLAVDRGSDRRPAKSTGTRDADSPTRGTGAAANERRRAVNECSGDHRADTGGRRRCGSLPEHVVARLVDELARRVRHARPSAGTGHKTTVKHGH